MIVRDEDHTEYLAHSYDGGVFQPIQFTKWGKGKRVLQAGTSCEELTRVLIDRVKHMDSEHHHETYTRTLSFLRMALMGLELRAAERNGIRLVTVDFNNIESITTCPVCGHIACEHKEEAAKEAKNA